MILIRALFSSMAERLDYVQPKCLTNCPYFLPLDTFLEFDLGFWLCVFSELVTEFWYMGCAIDHRSVDSSHLELFGDLQRLFLEAVVFDVLSRFN